ncbi:hypothetical protein [Candidatus Uabimicrobium sp. HlEnr_7]|uniref:hypothetical protein n=1 Tax=Candidatus Uabimicrobium helgolandensis TaxID=3095367 RepID=UPI003556AA79
MKWLSIIFVLLTVIFAEISIEEQLQANEQKANTLHKKFTEDFNSKLENEFSKWQENASVEQQKKIQVILAAINSNVAKINAELKEKRKELVDSESKKIKDAFVEIKKQGTPEDMLRRRGVAMGHTLFHALQKIYQEERERVAKEYWQAVNDCLQVIGEKKENIDKNIRKREVAFKLEESIKTRTHNLTHTFQVLNEYEFSDDEKTWILELLTKQIKAEEIVRSSRNERLDGFARKYLAAKEKASGESKEALLEVKKIDVEIKKRRVSYERNLAMYTQRRMANLQREVYYFKGFIDAEIGRYKKANFPQSVIDTLEEKHWKVFLKLTGSNFQRWLVEDNIIFIRFLVKELALYDYSSEEVEEYLLKILK